jgi:TldD protein
MKRRDFMQMSGMGIGALMMPSVPVIGSPVAAEHLLEPWIDAAAKKNCPKSR